MSLTEDQIGFFGQNGFLILEDFIEQSIIETWREQIWRHFHSSPDSPETWPDMRTVEGFEFHPPEIQLVHLPHVRAIVQQLGGGDFADGSEAMMMQWPQPPGTEWTMPSGGHIDGYGPRGWSPFMLGATTYLYPVESGGGGFVYWPKSHRTTHEYFRGYPDQIDGSFRDAPGWDWDRLVGRSPEGPREFTARAGDLLLWHCYLVHGGSMNVRRMPRFGLICRWTHARQEEIKYEVPEDLWRYWSV